MRPEHLDQLQHELLRLRALADALEEHQGILEEPTSDARRAALRDTWIAVTALRDGALRIEEALQAIAMARSR